MKEAIFCMAILAIAVLATCGGDESGPHCVKTCFPECISMTQWCDGTTCKDYRMCDPICDLSTQICDVKKGTCVDIPAVCDPACDTQIQYCDDGTCKDYPETPICEPACAEDEVCVN